LKRKFIIGSRGSRLALWQTEHVRAELENHFSDVEFEIRIIKTQGDRILDISLAKIGDKGLFTKEIENALLDGTIDLAVHSLKDLPTTQPEGLEISAVTRREIPNDVLIAKLASSIADLPHGANVATGSLRRRSQLLNMRPDVQITDMRGNVPTRIEKFLASDLDAMILAYAGVHRLGLDRHICQVVPTDQVLPAVGQGALAIETRTEDGPVAEIVSVINDTTTEICIKAERAFLRALDGGCQVPVAAMAVLRDQTIHLRSYVGTYDGASAVRESLSGTAGDAENLGSRLANICVEAGAVEMIAAARKEANRQTVETVL
jgi:hydroxymethylbilane synthase